MLKISGNTVFYFTAILFVFVIAEITIFTHYALYKSRFLTWVYFLSGILIAVIPLFRYEKPFVTVKVEHTTLIKKVFTYAVYLFFLVLLYQFVYLTETFKLNFRNADMLPSIEILAKRWLSGKKVYTPLTEIERPEVLYGPGFWMPYLFSILLKADLRWTSFFFFMLGIGFLWYKASRTKINAIALVLLYLLIGISVYFYFFQVQSDFTITQEPLIVGYYLILGYVLLQDNKYQWLWAGIMIGLLLLSRFSFLLWVLFYVIYVWKYEGIKKAVKTSTVIGLLILILFFIPFGVDGIKKFATLPSFQAKQMAERFASTNHENTLGMAKFFSSRDGWFIYDLQRGFSVLIMLVGIVTILVSPKWADKRWMPIVFLKLILVFFCNFLQMGYSYLFAPSTFLSLIIIIGFVQQKIEWIPNTPVSDSSPKTPPLLHHKGILLILFMVPLVLYVITQTNYLKNKYLPYHTSSREIFVQNIDHLKDEKNWVKTYVFDSTVAHTGKYSNVLGLNSPYSCTFNIPFEYVLDKKYKGIRFSAWVKSNEIQEYDSKMSIGISSNEKMIFYAEKDISPPFIKDNVWRKHVFAITFPEEILHKKEYKQGSLSAFLSYFDTTNYIYIDDMSIEFF